MSHEGDYLALLRRRDLPSETLSRVLSDPAARRLHAVRLALAKHPRAPRSEALSLVTTLFWRDLANISADVRVHPEIRRAADRDLLRRLSDLAVAERMDLARIVGRGTLVVLRLDPDPRVVAALLDNRFAIEGDVVQSAARAGAPPEVLEVIAAHPRWSLRPAIRSTLLRNAALPVPSALALLPRATRDDLELLRSGPRTPTLLRACAERVLADRSGEV